MEKPKYILTERRTAVLPTGKPVGSPAWISMTREETVKNLLTELIDMIDNGSQRDLDRADKIGTSIIKLFEQESILNKISDEIEQLPITDTAIAIRDHQLKDNIINKIKAIVAEWKADTWTNNFSYECMRKIADILVESEE